MMKSAKLFTQMVGMAFVLVILVGCTQLAAPLPTETPTVAPSATHDSGPEDTATARAILEATEQAEQTAEALAAEAAEATSNAQATLDTQATADFEASATAAQKTQDMQDFRSKKSTATAEAQLAITAQAQPMYDVVQQLHADGILASTKGEYIRASDFDQSWAQLGWYDLWPVVEAYGVNMNNFVIRADFAWTSASDKANWNQTGCGFAIYDMETKRHHVVTVRADGYANMSYNDGGNTAYIKAKNLTDAKGVPDGDAGFVMAVQDMTITVYVNGEQAFSYTEPLYKPGVLAYTLISGTNKDYGTRCKMTNVGLWAMEASE